MAAANKNQFPLPAFKFSVEIDGKAFSFQEVSGLEAEIEYEKISMAGGGYRYTPKGISYQNIVLKRGFLGGSKGRINKVIEVFMRKDFVDESTYTRPLSFRPFNIIINLMSEKGSIEATWVLYNAIPVKWNISGFNSTENAIAVEQIEFSYHYFTMQ